MVLVCQPSMVQGKEERVHCKLRVRQVCAILTNMLCVCYANVYVHTHSSLMSTNITHSQLLNEHPMYNTLPSTTAHNTCPPPPPPTHTYKPPSNTNHNSYPTCTRNTDPPTSSPIAAAVASAVTVTFIVVLVGLTIVLVVFWQR